jgi:hypothetical protein
MKMTSTTHRRLSRLERRAAPIVAARKQREAEEAARLGEAANDHATRLVTLILHGEPRIEEPLAIAWHRALDHLGLTGTSEALLPIILRKRVIAALPGDTENDKLAPVLGSAPQWLLTFCMGFCDGLILGISLPKDSEASPEPGCDAIDDMRRRWPLLPTGTIGAGGPIPDVDFSALDELIGENPFDALDGEEIIDLMQLDEKGEKHWSRRDRRRRREIMAKILGTDDLIAGMRSHLARSTSPVASDN